MNKTMKTHEPWTEKGTILMIYFLNFLLHVLSCSRTSNEAYDLLNWKKEECFR